MCNKLHKNKKTSFNFLLFKWKTFYIKNIFPFCVLFKRKLKDNIQRVRERSRVECPAFNCMFLMFLDCIVDIIIIIDFMFMKSLFIFIDKYCGYDKRDRRKSHAIYFFLIQFLFLVFSFCWSLWKTGFCCGRTIKIHWISLTLSLIYLDLHLNEVNNEFLFRCFY